MRIESATSQSALSPTRAILLYEADGKPDATCSIHPIARPTFAPGEGEMESTTGPPLILPGEAMTPEALEAIFQKLAGTVKQSRSLFPANVLCAEAGRLIWHLPAHRRLIFFQTGDKALDAISGKEVLHPALLFCAEGRALYVFALAGNARPTGKTVLYKAPYYNLYLNGHMCNGATRAPKTCMPRDIAAWERLFFDTNFSHTNSSLKELTRHPKGHTGLWLEMSKTGRGAPKVFPAKYLVPAKKKLEVLLNAKL